MSLNDQYYSSKQVFYGLLTSPPIRSSNVIQTATHTHTQHREQQKQDISEFNQHSSQYSSKETSSLKVPKLPATGFRWPKVDGQLLGVSKHCQSQHVSRLNNVWQVLQTTGASNLVSIILLFTCLLICTLMPKCCSHTSTNFHSYAKKKPTTLLETMNGKYHTSL